MIFKEILISFTKTENNVQCEILSICEAISKDI